jgi:hypothetical protein
MLSVLAEAAEALPQLLADRGCWSSLYVDFHPPIVERLWTPFGKYRLHLHKIYPCTREEALFHPHPWPSAMMVCGGFYETGTGCGKPKGKPPQVHGPTILATGSVYQMADPSEWHYVRPINHPCFCMMVTGEPFPSSRKPKKHDLRPLTETEANSLFSFFDQHDVQIMIQGDTKRALN